MLKKLIIGNWKMQIGLKESEILAKEIAKKIEEKKNQIDWDKIEVVICPSLTAIETVARIFHQQFKIFSKQAKISLKIGAQDCFWEEKGAFTGEVSPRQLQELGCEYVIIGHSERRDSLKEDDQIVNNKVKAVLKTGLTPIICIGETLQERQKGIKDYVIIQQLTKALSGIELKPKQKIVIAYEPVWVIGTGQAVEAEEIGYLNKIIFQQMIDLFPLPIIRNNIRIVYGGSVDPANVKEFLVQDKNKGVLLGGASLKVAQFIKIIEQFN